MSQPSTESIDAFMRDYEEANNIRDIPRLRTMIDDKASYWFSDGSYEGIESIIGAIERTFATIQNELYQISDLSWVAVTSNQAVCRYRFSWRGTINGKQTEGKGRGTNVLTSEPSSTNPRWKIVHEHLSL